ncbi:MAG: glycoside hydrolase family 2 protein [Clostridia bacterium]|nr:glycoside hydrolase family 2 protein [Clostridia bacterium]
MELNLGGTWNMRQKGEEKVFPAKLPGTNYEALIANSIIPDVFFGTNEKDVKWVGEKDWEFSRQFDVDASLMAMDFIFLKISGVDTLADISINGQLVAHTENAHTAYCFDIKKLVKVGENSISIYICSPINYVNMAQKSERFPYSLMGISGFQHMRKPAYHFGWDWGPILPPSGITGAIMIESFSKAYIEDVEILQRHEGGKVTLEVAANIQCLNYKGLKLLLQVADAGQNIVYREKIPISSLTTVTNVEIEKPELWFPNGFKDRQTQPLYTVEVSILHLDSAIDTKQYSIGLRTITLDTSSDEYGSQFAFFVNGIRFFAKGGNWIPSDSFVTRISPEKLEYLIKSCAEANMNMIRVWGGGYYESDMFYELCDRFGIMVWQDFAFACQPYPLFDTDYVENVKSEVVSNVKRLRHHASLALWCGNNEIESMTFSWKFNKKYVNSTEEFFYRVLPECLAKHDKQTAYWYGSPSGGEFLKDINSDSCGDTHLWHVWHGLMPFNYYKKRFTRFCSEFGFESMPSFDAIKTFAAEKDFSLFSDVMLSHQKCRSGNSKIMYYMVDNYCIPDKFFDLIYISQLVQAESIRHAVEHWRRHAGRCNGALYWQINDCWPVLSWSSIDYEDNWKALQYFAKRFFAPVAVSVDNEKNKVAVFAVNDSDKAFVARINWRLCSFDGTTLEEGGQDVAVESNSRAVVNAELPISLYNKQKRQSFLSAELASESGEILSQCKHYFVKTRRLKLKKADIAVDLAPAENGYKITLSSNTLVKNIMLYIEGMRAPFSDNFFDLAKGESKEIFFCADGDNVKERLTLTPYNNVVARYSRPHEKLIKFKIAAKPINFVSRILYKFV